MVPVPRGGVNRGAAAVFDFCWHSLLMSAKKFSDTPCATATNAHFAPRSWPGDPRQRPKTKISQYPRRTAMKFRPLHDRVVVKRIDAEQKTAGGIIIPDSAQEKPSQGEIIAVGPGNHNESGKLTPIDNKESKVVLFGKWSGTEVKIDGQDLLI